MGYIDDGLNKVEKEYGVSLRKIIEGVLEINPDHRKSMSQTKLALEEQFKEIYMVLEGGMGS